MSSIFSSKRTTIRYTDWGIAYAMKQGNKNIIELNKELNKCQELKKRILKHEKEHLKNPDFFSTLLIEIKDMFDFKRQYLITKNLSWKIRIQSLIPIWHHKKQWNINSSLLFIYLIIGIIVIH